MKIIQRVFDFYLDASIHVALAVFALVMVTNEILNISVDSHFSWFLFFATIACYNFIKYGVEAEKYILVANHYHKNIQLFSFVALVPTFYHAYFLNIETWLGIGSLLLLVGFYALPVSPNARNLRSLGVLKIFIVALVWSGITVMVPLLSDKGFIFSWDVYIEAAQRFVLVFILLVPFEIRDLAYDHENLKTLPQRYGVANTKFFGAFGVILFFTLTFLKDYISQTELIGKGLLFLILGSLMFIAKRNQSKYFSSFWVESIPILWWVLVLLMNKEF